MFSRSSSRLRRPVLGAIAMSLAGVLAVAGCSSAVDQAADSGAEVTEGGVLRIGDASDLTPASVYSGATAAQVAITGLVHDSLLHYASDSLEPRPELATSWAISEDGRTVKLALRENVTFHDGRPFTSKDVEFSLRTYADPKRAGQLARTAALITDYDTSNPNSITLTLSRPTANLLDLFDIVPIIDQNTFADFEIGKAYNGTGAFRFAEWKPGSSLTFEANEQYWDGAPHLDGVEIVLVPDTQTRISQLRSGQLDVLHTVSARDADQLASDSKFTVIEQSGVERTTYIGADVTAPGLNDVRLRRAIAYAIDRERILADVYQGHGNTDNLPWPEYSPAFDEDLNTTYTHNPERAKELVAEVGTVPVIPISYTTGSIESEATAQIVQADLEAVGIATTLAPLDSATNIKHLIGGTYGGLWITGHTFAQYTPITLPTSAYPFNADKNTSNFIDPNYRSAVDEAWKVVDPTGPEAVATYKNLNSVILDNAFVIGLHNAEALVVTTSNLHGVEWTKKAELDLTDAYLGGDPT